MRQRGRWHEEALLQHGQRLRQGQRVPLQRQGLVQLGRCDGRVQDDLRFRGGLSRSLEIALEIKENSGMYEFDYSSSDLWTIYQKGRNKNKNWHLLK